MSLLFALAVPMLGDAIVAEGQQQQAQQPQQQLPASPQSPTQLKQATIVELAMPAVVQVAFLSSGQVAAYDWTIGQDLMLQDLQFLVDQGALDPNDDQAVGNARMQLFFQDPAAYIVPVKSVSETEAQLGFSGSGFIVTQDGYIVTNAHVAAPPQQEIEYQLLQDALQRFVGSDLQGLSESGIALTEEQENAFINALSQHYAANMGITSLNSGIYILNRYPLPGVQSSDLGIPAELITSATGQPAPGKDVAVLKIEATNLPTIPIGDDTQLQPLDDVIIIGFPGVVSSNPLLSQTGQEPSVLAGEFGGYQPTVGGWRAMHIQAPIEHGNSGGPAMDSSGRVVGLATFGSIDLTTGQSAPGFNFLVPVSIVKDFLNRAGVQPTESQFTTMYRQALTHYSAGNYQEALNMLQQINALSPNNPYVLNHISRAQQQANSASNAGNTSSSP